MKFYLRAANLIKGAQDPLLGRLRVLGIATRGDLYNSKTIGSEVAKKNSSYVKSDVTVNSGELRIPYPVHNNSGLRDREIYDLVLP